MYCHIQKTNMTVLKSKMVYTIVLLTSKKFTHRILFSERDLMPCRKIKKNIQFVLLVLLYNTF